MALALQLVYGGFVCLLLASVSHHAAAGPVYDCRLAIMHGMMAERHCPVVLTRQH
jgi:hypothetical protein